MRVGEKVVYNGRPYVVIRVTHRTGLPRQLELSDARTGETVVVTVAERSKGQD